MPKHLLGLSIGFMVKKGGLWLNSPISVWGNCCNSTGKRSSQVGRRGARVVRVWPLPELDDRHDNSEHDGQGPVDGEAQDIALRQGRDSATSEEQQNK